MKFKVLRSPLLEDMRGQDSVLGFYSKCNTSHWQVFHRWGTQADLLFKVTDLAGMTIIGVRRHRRKISQEAPNKCRERCSSLGQSGQQWRGRWKGSWSWLEMEPQEGGLDQRGEQHAWLLPAHFYPPVASPLSPVVCHGAACSLWMPVLYSPVSLSWDVRGLALAPGRCEISSDSSKEGEKATPAGTAFWNELLFVFMFCFCF